MEANVGGQALGRDRDLLHLILGQVQVSHDQARRRSTGSHAVEGKLQDFLLEPDALLSRWCLGLLRAAHARVVDAESPLPRSGRRSTGHCGEDCVDLPALAELLVVADLALLGVA